MARGIQYIKQAIIFGIGKFDNSYYQYPNSYQEDQRSRALILFSLVSTTRFSTPNKIDCFCANQELKSNYSMMTAN
jgi:hypothetical protein